MKCHYEVLNVERQADEAQIKTAYRKAALKYHPDKNLDDPEGAKTQFQIVQQAYEVLSDPQERAWYDRHREQILNSGSEYEDNALSVFQYFTASCYTGFADDEKGFYTVFRNVFETLAAEEIEHLESEAEFEAIPKFGDSASDYDEVVQRFYAFWQSFSTKKSYAWLSTHNINDIRDRRILKVVEKENKKVQTKARKERNEEIRGLVSFVRKRDKRVQAHRKLLEERAAENRKRQAQFDLEQVMKRKQELAEQVKNRSNSVDHEYEEKLRQLEKAMQSSDDDDDDEEEGLTAQMQDVHIEDMDELMNGDQQLDCEFFCVACNKTFKTRSSYRNHESSKKHRENVELIKMEMLEEDADLKSGADEESEKSHTDQELEEEPLVIEVEQPSTSTGKGKKKKQQKGKSAVAKPIASSDDEEDVDANMFLQTDAAGSAEDDDWGASKAKSKGKAKAKPVPSKKENKVKKGHVPKSEKNDKSDPEEEDSEVVDLDHKCVTCSEQFTSKNKLYQHLKKTNHGVYIPKGKVVTQADVSDLRKGKSGGGGKRK